MKTLQQIKEQYESQTLDGRDLSRLMQFIPESELVDFGMKLPKDYIGTHKHLEFTKENILIQLEKDVDFGFEKALNKRGISASFMSSVVQMWNWILEEGLEDFDDYMWYGLPILKATAVKYGFMNPIGEDNGDEPEYGDDE